MIHTRRAGCGQDMFYIQGETTINTLLCPDNDIVVQHRLDISTPVPVGELTLFARKHLSPRLPNSSFMFYRLKLHPYHHAGEAEKELSWRACWPYDCHRRPPCDSEDQGTNLQSPYSMHGWCVRTSQFICVYQSTDLGTKRVWE